MTDDGRGSALEAWITALEGVVTALESADASDVDGTAELARAWSRCDAAFAELRARNEACADRTASTDFHGRLDHARKLHSMATSLARRAGEVTGEEIERVAVLRRKLKRRDELPTLGESCDVRA